MGRGQRQALGQSAWSTSPEVAPNYGHPAALLARSRWVRRVRRPAGACWRRWWPQRKGGAVWRVKAANRCIGYLRYSMRALPSPVVRNGGGDPAALVGPCCCCKAQILLLLCDASCHLPKCGVWVQPIGLRSLRGVHARARPSPRRQRSAENLPFSHSLKWQCACLHIQRYRLMQTINVPEKITRFLRCRPLQLRIR